METEALAGREQVSHLFFFGLEIFFGVLARLDFARHTLDYTKSAFFQSFNLVRIIGEQAHAGDSERFENFSWQSEYPVIGFESQAFVGLDRVESSILQLVSLELRHQANTAAFLLFVDQNARPFAGDQGKRQFELLAAIAAKRMEYITGQALGMHAHQRRRGLHVSHDQSYSFFDRVLVPVTAGSCAKTVDPEMSPPRGEIGRSNLLHCRFVHCSIIATVFAPCDFRFTVASTPENSG